MLRRYFLRLINEVPFVKTIAIIQTTDPPLPDIHKHHLPANSSVSKIFSIGLFSGEVIKIFRKMFSFFQQNHSSCFRVRAEQRSQFSVV